MAHGETFRDPERSRAEVAQRTDDRVKGVFVNMFALCSTYIP